MKTETTSPAPRPEATRTAHANSQGSAQRAQPSDKGAPADLFAQLLSAQKAQTEAGTETTLAPADDTAEAEATALMAAAGVVLPTGGLTESTTPAPTADSEEVDPRAAFLALFQPDTPLKGALEEATAPGDSPRMLDVGNANGATTAKGTEQPLGWTAPNPAGRAATKGGHATGNGVSETALLQRQGLESPPPLPLADTTAQLATKAWHMLQPGQPGSALTDTSLSASGWGQAVATAAGGLGQGGQGQTGSDGSPQGGASQARVWLDQPGTPSSNDITPGAEADFAMSLGEAMGDAYEALGTQVSVWSAANTKRASMTVDLGQERALEVDVSLNDGKAQLAFRTDDVQVRENLRTQAETILSDLLARSGIALDSLSVGGQQTGRGHEHDGPGPQTTRVQLQLEPDTAQRPDGTLAKRTGQGRAGLSVYA